MMRKMITGKRGGKGVLSLVCGGSRRRSYSSSITAPLFLTPQKRSNRIEKVFHGTIIHSRSVDDIEIIPKGFLAVTDSGHISHVIPDKTNHSSPPSNTTLKQQFISLIPSGQAPNGLNDFNLESLPPRGFLVPGFVDTHIHAPQYVYTGTALDLPLLDWLNKYTFPTEAKFKSPDFAENVYSKVIRRTLKSGTTTAAYYSTTHRIAALILAEKAIEFGQRAFIGKVSMDRNSPDFYVETTQEAIDQAHQFIHDLGNMNSSLVAPAITPRFVPTCSVQLMKELGKLADQYKLLVQSHISENKKEVEWVKQLHNTHKSYTHVYDDCGLLNERTVMGHGVYLGDEELDTFKTTQSSVAHCPSSNFSISSGVLNVRSLLNKGVKVSLGTDVSAGYSFSMLDAFRQAMSASKVTYTLVDEKYTALKFREGYYLATLAGAEVMGLGKVTGNFEVGKVFDALVVDPDVEGTPFDVFDQDQVDNRFEKWLYLGDDRNIVKIFVQGRERLANVKEAEHEMQVPKRIEVAAKMNVKPSL
eukprot:TRINITY_DN4698_c0_g2_i1.p1 TRINITY_DN4698_c0_g2~~TRINITY_DN4698_c0_g2_i1.p1  ORF type:complete len:529 (+),score=111.39 TRINITY_DN4698_c0_g2_i1:14-1600(+)